MHYDLEPKTDWPFIGICAAIAFSGLFFILSLMF